jgi:hypothetical protein
VKVRVLKEMPFANKGEVHEIECGSLYLGGGVYYYEDQTRQLIKDGWLEIIPERKTRGGRLPVIAHNRGNK